MHACMYAYIQHKMFNISLHMILTIVDVQSICSYYFANQSTYHNGAMTISCTYNHYFID